MGRLKPTLEDRKIERFDWFIVAFFASIGVITLLAGDWGRAALWGMLAIYRIDITMANREIRHLRAWGDKMRDHIDRIANRWPPRS